MQSSGRAVALTDSAETLALFVTVAYVANATDAQGEIASLFADLHYNATPTAAPTDTTLGGHRGIVAAYRGDGRAGTVRCRVAVVLSEFGTGVTVLGLAPETGFVAVSAAAASVAASVEAELPTTNVALVAALRGSWDYESEPTGRDSAAAGSATVHERLEFDGREQFTRAARTVVTIRGGNPITAESEDDSGSYTVVGSTLILRGKVKPRAVDFRLAGLELRLGGRVYRRQPN